MSRDSISALNDLFFGNKDAEERSTRINTMIKRILTEKEKTSRGVPELEAILEGFPGGRQEVTMTQFHRLVGFLRSRASRETEGESVYMNIQPQTATKEARSVRATVHGDDAIRDYCEEDRLPEDATFMEKTFLDTIIKGKGRVRESVSDDNLGFRVNLKRETTVESSDMAVREILRGWDRLRKSYRIIQRESFGLGAFRIDCSRVRQGEGRTLEQSGVLDKDIHYEVEIELIHSRVVPGVAHRTLLQQFLKLIMRMIQILRGSWFLMTQDDVSNTIKEYTTLTNQTLPTRGNRLPAFVGPMPITLERSMIPLVRSGYYTATQKADGERAFLMIDSKGVVTFIYRTMDIESTGIITKNTDIYNTIMDGEVITKAADGSLIHPPMFLAFDCYMVNKKITTGLPLVAPELDAEEHSKEYVFTSRMDAAHYVIMQLNTPGKYSVLWGDDKHAVSVDMKPFIVIPEINERDSYAKAEELITNLIHSKVVYGTDGLIFTPVDEPVRGYRGEDSLVQIRGTWSSVMKWKPPEDNTVDFLLRIDGSRKLSTKESGISMTLGSGRVRDGTLYVLGDRYDDSTLFELQDAGDDELRRMIPKLENQAVPFQRGVSKIQLEMNHEGVILARSGEAIMDNMIVECAWDPEMESVADEAKGGWFVRNVRWDKTATFRRNGDPRGTMNAERTAASVWVTAVEDPVHLEDIWSVDAVFDDEPDGGGEDTREGYFNRKGSRAESLLARMVDFHNLVVKASLISPTDKSSTRDATFVDIACGQGGDIPRFQSTGAAFVFGLDIEPDNILNRERGAIRRYVTRRLDLLSGGGRGKRRMRYSGKIVPMRFALADCGKDLFADSDDIFAGIGDKSKEIIRHTLGKRGRTSAQAASRARDYRAITVGNGVDRVTCMFAFHYFFRDSSTINTFFRNVRKLLRPRKSDDIYPPCFIGCCFDGDKVEELLSKEGGEDNTVSRYSEEGKLAWSIKGYYDKDESSEDSLGLRIGVYIETINKEHDEFIVKDTELVKQAASHGLRYATPEEAISLGFTDGRGSFEELFDTAPPSGTGKALHMNEYEKALSFLYRWFVLVPDSGSA